MLIVGIIYVSVSLDATGEIAMVISNYSYRKITKLLCCQTNLSKTSTLLVYDGFRYFKLFFLKTLRVMFYCYFLLYTKPVYVFKSCNKNIE